MTKYLKTLLATWLVVISFNFNSVSAEEHDHDHNENDSFSADHHHDHGTIYANFIPNQILNPDDSEYVAPEATENYVGLYTAQASIEELDVNLKMILNIREDGVFNLAYYFENSSETKGLRFYANEENVIETIDAPYQDLVLLTGALREGDGGLGSGLIGETISPIVLLDSQGKAEELYTYMNMAFGLRETHVNARVYQSIGLYIADEVVVVDVNHLIGLESDQQMAVHFQKVEGKHEDQFLVETPTYELLQHNFDTHLIEHKDFKMDFQTANEFVQKVLAMQLKTNASFPKDTQVVMVEAEDVELNEGSEVEYTMLINDEILYAFDGERLYMATEIEETNGQYTAEKWITN